MKLGRLAAFAILVTASLAEASGSDWEKYSGAWFDISYPKTFKASPVQKSETSIEGYDSVRCVSPSGDVEFYVCSPQWRGHSSALDVDPLREHVTSKKVSMKGEENNITDTWLCITAVDKSYVRFVHDRDDSIQGSLTFSVKCKDMKTYLQHENDYKKFRKSLVQYGD